MSDLTQLLDSLAAVAAKDYTKSLVPALAGAVLNLGEHPAAPASIGVTLLGELATGGVAIAEDEVSALLAWTVGEAQKLAGKIQKPVGTPA